MKYISENYKVNEISNTSHLIVGRQIIALHEFIEMKNLYKIISPSKIYQDHVELYTYLSLAKKIYMRGEKTEDADLDMFDAFCRRILEDL